MPNLDNRWKYTTRFLSRLLIVCCLLVLVECGKRIQAQAKSCPDVNSPFLQACGDKLFLRGQEYRELGLNFYLPLRMYLGWDDGYPKGRGKEFAKKQLRDISAHGFKFIRVMGQFSLDEFNQTFFDDNPKLQTEKRKKFFTTFDEFLGECDRLGIKIAYDLMWNNDNLADLGGHSLHEAITNPNSLGYRRFQEIVRAIAGKYKNRATIAMWGISNEMNLRADLGKNFHVGVMEPIPPEHPSFGRLYRGPANNYSSLELGIFFDRAVAFVKSIDPNHLVATHNSEPSRSAFNLLKLNSNGGGWPVNKDNLFEHYLMLWLLEHSADVFTTHYYINEETGLKFYKDMAKKHNKPIYVNEIGPHFENVERGDSKITVNTNYGDLKVIEDTKRKANEIVDLGLPATLWWAYDCRDGDPTFRLCYGKTDKALAILEEANKKLKKRR